MARRRHSTCWVAVARHADVLRARLVVVVLASFAVGAGRVVPALNAVTAVAGAAVQLLVEVTAVRATVAVTR